MDTNSKVAELIAANPKVDAKQIGEVFKALQELRKAGLNQPAGYSVVPPAASRPPLIQTPYNEAPETPITSGYAYYRGRRS